MTTSFLDQTPMLPRAPFNQWITREEFTHMFHYDPETGELKNLQKYARPIRGTQVMISSRNYYIHRIAWWWVMGQWPEHQIDHKDGNPRNNKFSNLREATDAENKQNVIGPRKGYTRHGLKFRAKVGVDGEDVMLGSFETEDEAHGAYIAAKKKFHPFFIEENLS